MRTDTMLSCALPLIFLAVACDATAVTFAQSATDPVARVAARRTLPIKIHSSFDSMNLNEYFQVNPATILNAPTPGSRKSYRSSNTKKSTGFNQRYKSREQNPSTSNPDPPGLNSSTPHRLYQFQDLPTIEVPEVENDIASTPSSAVPQIRDGLQSPQKDSAFDEWWLQQVNENSEHDIGISVDQIVLSMLQNSPEIRAISQEPIIASTFIDQESAKFDPISFLESRWDDTNEPVGNILTTNSSPFLKEHIVDARAGFRKKNRIGTELDLSQSIGFKNSNSDFFQPQDQGTARLELNINQPVLNGAGRVVGTSRILLAQIDHKVAGNQYAKRLQDKILTAIRAYWELHFQKASYVLHKKNYEAAEKLLTRLKGRQSFDTQRSQIIRAEAAIAARKLDLVRSLTDIRNAETIIREITRDSTLGRLGVLNQPRLAPCENPVIDERLYPVLPLVVKLAYDNRPEIQEAVHRLKAAGIQNNVAKNQLLPQLSLLLNVYSAALNGETGIESALQRQLTASTPGYSAGFVFEYPLHNRAAIARKHRVEAEINKLSSELDDVFGRVTAEVEIAFRELKMAAESIRQAKASIIAAQKDQSFIQSRWENFAFLENPDFSSPTIFLEQLLDAQDRITEVEIQYADASRKFMVATAELRKAEGSLLGYREVKGSGLGPSARYGNSTAPSVTLNVGEYTSSQRDSDAPEFDSPEND